MAGEIELWTDGEVLPLKRLKSQRPSLAAPPRNRTRDEAAVYEQGRARAAELAVGWQLQEQAGSCQAEHAKNTVERIVDATEHIAGKLNAVTDPEVKRLTRTAGQNMVKLLQIGQVGYFQTTMVRTDDILEREFLPPPTTLWERLTGQA